MTSSEHHGDPMIEDAAVVASVVIGAAWMGMPDLTRTRGERRVGRLLLAALTCGVALAYDRRRGRPDAGEAEPAAPAESTAGPPARRLLVLGAVAAIGQIGVVVLLSRGWARVATVVARRGIRRPRLFLGVLLNGAYGAVRLWRNHRGDGS